MDGLLARRLRAGYRLTGLLWVLAGLAPAGAATLDLEDLAPPKLGPQMGLQSPSQAPSPPPGAVPSFELKGPSGLPAPSPALDTAGQEAFRKAAALFLAQDFAGAEKIARALTQSLPDAPEGWYLLGMALANLDQREEAVDVLERAAQGYRNNAAPLVIKGDLLLSLARPEAAGEAWQKAVQMDPGNAEARSRLAAYLESGGDRAGALREYKAALSLAPEGDWAPHLQAARLALLVGDPTQAEALLEPIAARPDAPALALDYLGRAKVGLEKLSEGAALFDRLIPIAQSPRPALARARIAVAAQDLPKAAEVLAAARLRFPDDPTLLLEAGRILGAQGDYAAALSAFERGLAARPKDLALLRGAALAANRLGTLPPALSYARQAASLPEATAQDQLQLAALLSSSGERDEAEASYRALLAKEPDHWLALNNLANLLLETAPAEALSLAERAVALKPDARLRDTLGMAQMKSGDLEAAERTFEALRTETPTAALPAFRLGQLRLAEGQTAAGRVLLEEALRLDPAFSQAPEARRLLD